MLVGVVSWLVASTLLGLGNTVGYHRLLTHRSFETFRVVRWAFTALGALHSGSPLAWVALHRLHHARSDGDDDPHSPRDGMAHAHCGWLIGSKNPAICALFALSGFGQQGAILVHDLRRLVGLNPPVWMEGVPDLRGDFFLRFLDLPLVLPLLFMGQLVAAWMIGGGWGILWLWLLHLCLTNGSWAVNSIGHWTAVGEQAFNNRDTSRNVWWLALFTWGEGYHNTHHRFPRSARHGLNEAFDSSWVVIRVLGLVGLAWDIWLPRAYRTSITARMRGKFS